MRLVLVVVAALLAASPAWAQVAPPGAPAQPDPAVDLQQDWQAFITAQKHVVGDLSALVVEVQRLRAETASLKAELEKVKTPAVPAPSPSATK